MRVLPVSAKQLLILGLVIPTAALAQSMKVPGEASSVSNVLKPAALQPTPELIAGLKVPAGFKIEKYAEGLNVPRVIAVSQDGNVYVSSRDDGTISLLRANAKPAAPTVVLRNKDVHGIAISNRTIFYATVRELFAAPLAQDGSIGKERLIANNLPDAGQHANRTLGLSPDGMLFLSIGSTCNSCDERNPENATIVRMRPDGTRREIFASGLRNTIGFAWEPSTGQLYGLDNGIDAAGDDQQKEELNRLEQGKKYGWPYVHGDGLKDSLLEPKAGSLDDWDKASIRPVLTHTAHAAPMQMAFANRSSFPKDYQGDAFATMKGSWNRSTPSGYEVVRIRFENGAPKSIEPFVTGFLVKQADGKWGRFARVFGLAWTKDGSLLIGDEQNGVIYRVTADPKG